ncbi:MAG: NAD(P)-dependent oxidoreductase [Clostridiales bacterium]|jgi:UDP-glucose 4-epimerase|nr:NAD(P)-dependent oxidoreductase [Clostridiales bacterium]
MKAFVTGGTGFIGSYIVKGLVEKGHSVVIYARNPEKVSGFLNNDSISFVQGTMADTKNFAEGVKGCDAVIHVALAWGNTPHEMLENETLPSVRLFEAAAEAGVGKIIYTSSIAAFGTAPNTDSGFVKPYDNYGATKAAAEAYLMAVGGNRKTKVNVVRPGYTFGNAVVEGAFMYTDLKIKNMVKKALAGESMEFDKNDGTQFIWAGDLAKIFIALAESDLDRGYYTGVSAEFREWGQVAQMAVDVTGSKSQVIFHDTGRKAPEGLPIDVSQIKEAFGFSFSADAHMVDHLKYLAELYR